MGGAPTAGVRTGMSIIDPPATEHGAKRFPQHNAQVGELDQLLPDARHLQLPKMFTLTLITLLTSNFQL